MKPPQMFAHDLALQRPMAKPSRNFAEEGEQLHVICRAFRFRGALWIGRGAAGWRVDNRAKASAILRAPVFGE
jgi:hypothetical protein